MERHKQYYFKETFKRFYPFERYILNCPNNLTDTVRMTEILIDGNGELLVKMKSGYDNEFTMNFNWFSEDMQNKIMEMFVNDIGEDNWKNLYTVTTEEDDRKKLRDMFSQQCNLIREKYSECTLKEKYDVKHILDTLKDIMPKTNREMAIELINAYYDNKTIKVKDKKHGVYSWTNIKSSNIWTYLEEFCKNVHKYKIVEDIE